MYAGFTNRNTFVTCSFRIKTDIFRFHQPGWLNFCRNVIFNISSSFDGKVCQ